MTTVLIDYDAGNLHSAEKAFQRMALEADAGALIVSADPDVVASADRIVLPGDGAFPACRRGLQTIDGLEEALLHAVETKGKPFLGICVGMQMMTSWGREYEDVAGFGWIPGEVTQIAPCDPALKVPHMGWNDLVIDHPHAILDGVTTGDHAYFVHSYAMQPADPADLLAHVEYGGQVTAIVGRDTMVGMQFHPEKSQSAGLRMIANFLAWRP
ncbi:imidazole glycerol phosphate synthase subunit HisH [Jannaschia sp. CCS1]|uniref:imidazole glycerol phosphate synthase subunit HisH n=1 Tax=Jannaschia sp. (strain CCS1) TaxID=290400 RepID=UPI000053AA90|nr:imidazole glycerol phosphate synthase subunit HisH [Jannaschia sp. CCS1]ABD55706.1 imidazole glycerol phosphate synthase subunit hisH [Jannaschia sp. CCS1]